MSDALQPFLDARTAQILTAATTFKKESIYVFRFLIRNFLGELPKDRRPLVTSALSFLSQDVSNYQVLGVTIVKIKPYTSISIHGGGLALWSLDDTVMADDGTWILDIVVRPVVSEVAYTNPDQWVGWISNVFTNWGAYRPVVNIVGVVEMPLGMMSSNATFDYVYSWWRRRQAIRTIIACNEAEASLGKVECPKNEPTAYFGASWQAKKVGDDGLGLAMGLSDLPDQLMPLETLVGTVGSPGVLPLPDGVSTDTAVGPSAASKASTESWAIMGVFAFVGWFAYDKLFGGK